MKKTQKPMLNSVVRMMTAIPILTAALLPLAASAATLTYSNAVDTTITNLANWSAAPTFGSSNVNRWNINGTTTYTSNQSGTVLTEGRCLVIGSGDSINGSLTISSGTLGTASVGAGLGSLVGSPSTTGSNIASLILDGGNFVTAGEIGIAARGTADSRATLTVNSGSTFTADVLSIGLLNASATLGTINLNAGGTIATRVLREFVNVNSVVNLNGGTLRPTASTTDWIRSSLDTVNVLANGVIIDTAGFSATVNEPLLDGGGGGGLTKIGAGTLTLAAANTYSGGTIVSNGVLATTTASTGGGAYVLANGTTLELTQNPGGTLSMSTLTLGSNCTNTFRITPGSTCASITTALTNNGTVVVNVTHTSLTAAGTYPLLDYSATPGIVGGGTFTQGTISPLPGYSLRVTNDVSAKQVQLVVSSIGAKLLSWDTGAGDWNFATANWYNTISLASDTFTNGSIVTFGDRPSATTANINVPAAVSPGGMIIANEAGNYWFSGSAIGGTNGLIKSGAYQAWLLSSNSFTGVVQVNSGITVDAAFPPALVVSNGAALGAGGAGNGTVVNSGATVALVGGITVPNEEASIAGAGFPSTGAFGSGSRGALQSVSGSNVWNGSITLSADARIGAQDNASLTVNGAIGGTGSLVIRPSSNSVIRLNAQNTWTSNTLVFGSASSVVPYGTVLLGTNNALPTTTQLLHSNVRLDLNGFNQSVDGISPGGGSGPSSLIENGAAATTSTFTLANTTNTSWNGNIVDGAGVVAVVKTGPGQQILTGTNTYTGATTISAGELRIAGRLGATATGVSGTGTLAGTGSVGGAVTVSSGGTLSPGAGGVGTLTISNNLSLAGSVLIELNKSLSPSNDVLNVTGTLAYGGTMTVTNLGAALTLGDQFPIFPAGGTGTLAVSGNAGAGLAFDFNEATGVLSVVASAPSPTTLNFANVSSGVYQFSWTGPFTLQWQTNSAAVGLKTNWVAYPDISNPVNVTNDPTIPATFFRLISTP